jgi:hypothetical protein
VQVAQFEGESRTSRTPCWLISTENEVRNCLPAG